MSFHPIPYGSVKGEFIFAGTIITCPACGLEIGEILENVQHGDMLHFDQFHFFGTEYQVGDVAACGRCDTGWTRGGQIHTEAGWKP